MAPPSHPEDTLRSNAICLSGNYGDRVCPRHIQGLGRRVSYNLIISDSNPQPSLLWPSWIQDRSENTVLFMSKLSRCQKLIRICIMFLIILYGLYCECAHSRCSIIHVFCKQNAAWAPAGGVIQLTVNTPHYHWKTRQEMNAEMCVGSRIQLRGLETRIAGPQLIRVQVTIF